MCVPIHGRLFLHWCGLLCFTGLDYILIPVLDYDLFAQWLDYVS